MPHLLVSPAQSGRAAKTQPKEERLRVGGRRGRIPVSPFPVQPAFPPGSNNLASLDWRHPPSGSTSEQSDRAELDPRGRRRWRCSVLEVVRKLLPKLISFVFTYTVVYHYIIGRGPHVEARRPPSRRSRIRHNVLLVVYYRVLVLKITCIILNEEGEERSGVTLLSQV